MKRAAIPFVTLVILAFAGCSASPDQNSSPASSTTTQSSPVAAEQPELNETENTPAQTSIPMVLAQPRAWNIH